jgi:hypothetical protein
MSRPESDRWLDRPQTHNLIWWVLVGLCVALIAAEFIVERHPHFGFDALHGFNAWFGFAAFVIVVKLGSGLRRFIKREEDYYDPQDEA